MKVRKDYDLENLKKYGFAKSTGLDDCWYLNGQDGMGEYTLYVMTATRQFYISMIHCYYIDDLDIIYTLVKDNVLIGDNE